MSIQIRRLVRADAPRYRELMLEAYEKHPDAFTSSVRERADLPMTWWESRLANEPTAPNVVVGAFEEERLVGVAGVSFESREKACHKANLFGMYVPPRSRRSGVGKGLVMAALAEARMREGVRLVQLTVTQGNRAAETLYQGCGFVPFGVEPFAVVVEGAYVSKVHMWRALEDVGTPPPR